MSSFDIDIPPYYDRDFVEREFTPKQIADQGEHLLYRALNIGRAVGFIGSGVAAAYGRPTWTQLIDNPGDEIAEKVEGELDKEHNPAARRSRQAVIDTGKALRDAYIEGVSDPDLLPLRGHLYRSLGRGLKAAQEQPEAEDRIQADLKRRVRDDDFVVEQAWSAFLSHGPHPTDVTKHELYRRLDTWQTFSLLIGRFRNSPVMQGLVHHLEKDSRMGDHPSNLRLSVEERFLLPLCLAAMRLDRHTDYLRGLTKAAELLGQNDFDADGGRCDRMDPARIIMEDLGVRRLLTTNYDFELERALERMGFQPHLMRPNGQVGDRKAGALVATRPRGGRARSLVLKRDTAAELVGFGSDASDYDYEIFHLHGRALDGPDESLVITERDYQAVYMRDAPESHVMEEAMAATMAGNPIIFMGMGMLEADVLRPLRRFVSAPGEPTNRSIIALLPAEEAKPRRVRAALQLYLRYGVHVIFYGEEPEDGETVQPNFEPAPWMTESAAAKPDCSPLYRSISRIAALRTVLSGAQPAANRFRSHTNNHDPSLCRRMLEPIACEAFSHGQDRAFMGAVKEALTRTFCDPATWAEDGQSVREALSAFLTELDGRIRTRALCESLKRIGRNRQDWWRKWRELPVPRRYAHDIRSKVGAGEWLEHHDLSRPLVAQINSPDGPTFRSVRYGVKPANPSERPPDIECQRVLKLLLDPPEETDQSRRVFIVHGPAGSGRGTLFHDLSWRFADTRNEIGASHYGWGLFTNATFSSEYSSVVDGVVDFLRLLSKGERDRRLDELKAALTPPNTTRKDQLIEGLRRVHPSGQPPAGIRRRGLFVIGGAEILFRRKDGGPKNRAITDALSAFLEETTADLPIDVVLICRQDRLSKIFGPEAKLDPQSYPEEERQLPRVDRGRRLCFGSQSQATFVADLISLPPRNVTDIITEEVLAGTGKTVRELLSLLDDGLRERMSRLRPEWRRAMQGRFEASIVVACALATYWRHKDEADRAEAVSEFLVRLGDAYSKADTGQRSGLALSVVLRQYLALHRLQPSSASPEFAAGGHSGQSGVDLKMVTPDLCEMILKHLSIMSCPVETGVLMRCPEICGILDKLLSVYKDRPEPTKEILRVALLDSALWLLNHRRLVFELEPRLELRTDIPEAPATFRRYAVHQSLQSYFFRQIGSPHLELGDSRLFTVSSYASQRADLPAPNQAAYQFMTDLVRRLIGYPQFGFVASEPRPENQRRLDVCALRAAVGLVRSAFSLAVVSRYAEFGPREANHRSFGYMEEFRLLLRWAIYRAGELADEEAQDHTKGRISPDEVEAIGWQLRGSALAEVQPHEIERRLYKFERINALYQDEITWLYNECALVSLAQGNLYDSSALLQRARRSNERVETGHGVGPNALRIHLNQAIWCIERGRLDRANEILRQVYADASDDTVVRAIADGYIGLASHLKGRHLQAEEHYKSAIKKLRKVGGEGRALSIFFRHYGDLKRGPDPGLAQQLHAAALAEAETSRQYDQVHRVYIALAIDSVALAPDSSKAARSVLRRLDEVIQYADRMELYGIKVQALIARAFAIDNQGETRGAGDAAIQALSLANIHGQRLRVTGALHCFASIVAGRPNYVVQARTLLASAKAMAEGADYQLVLEKADQGLVRLGPIDGV